MHDILSGMQKIVFYLILFISSFISKSYAELTQGPPPEGFSGDVGLAVYSQNSITQGGSSATQVLPYGYFDYGRYFVRIDTFGIKTIPLGYGYLEFSGKYNAEGFTPKGTSCSLLNQRDLPIPLGIGTFQVTPIGAFFLNAYGDVAASKGKMAEFTYAAELALPLSVKIYPLVGFDYKDKQYLNYFYGVTSVEAQRSGINTYTPSDGTSPYAALIVEVPMSEHWILNTFLKRKWLASTIVNSPLVIERFLDNIFISLNYRFE
jgi:outer membrane protein